MKKLSFLFVCLISVLNISAEVYSGSCGENVSYSLDTETGVLSITGTGAMRDYISPNDIPWYSQRSSIKTAEVADGVTTLSQFVFYECSSITSVVIPKSVTSIGQYAFFSCPGLVSISVESGNSKYDSRNDCNAIIETSTGTLIVGCKNTTIPSSVTSIGQYSFAGCSGLTSVTIPNSVTSIGQYAFAMCSNLAKINIPSSVTFIGSEAFMGTTWLDNQPDGVLYAGNVVYKYIGTMPENTSISLKEGTTAIVEKVFYNCSGLVSIEIPNSVVYIGDNAFTGTAWDNNLPDGLQYAGKVAYKYKGTMPENTSITLKDGTTSIGYGAFSGCKGLTSIEIPNSVTSIGRRAFYECSGLTSIEIPNSVTSIGSSAFSGCSGLTSVNIPNGVTEIKNYTFSGCSGLTEVIIPNSVTTIGAGAFDDCNSLTSVTIPNSVTSIGTQAFHECQGLTSVSIPNSVTSIGYGAFSNCTRLAEVKIGSGVTSIEGEAFYCWNLKEVYCYAEKVPTTGDRTFVSDLSRMTLYVPDASAAAYMTTEPWKNFGTIKTMSGETPEIPETPKCATPTLSLVNGKLEFACETEGVEYIFTATPPSEVSGSGNDIFLSTKYLVKVYAKKKGYEDSDVATKEIEVSGGSTAKKGDVNEDGTVNGTDIQEVINIIVNAD